LLEEGSSIGPAAPDDGKGGVGRGENVADAPACVACLVTWDRRSLGQPQPDFRLTQRLIEAGPAQANNRRKATGLSLLLAASNNNPTNPSDRRQSAGYASCVSPNRPVFFSFFCARREGTHLPHSRRPPGLFIDLHLVDRRSRTRAARHQAPGADSPPSCYYHLQHSPVSIPSQHSVSHWLFRAKITNHHGPFWCYWRTSAGPATPAQAPSHQPRDGCCKRCNFGSADPRHTGCPELGSRHHYERPPRPGRACARRHRADSTTTNLSVAAAR